MRRLIGRGAVIAEDRGKKTKWYVVAERMYNIYYLMRRRGKPADRVKATVKFMVSMYDPESAARLIAEEASGLSPEVCRDHYLAYEETIKEVRSRQLLEKIVTSTPKTFLESPYLSEMLRNIMVVDQEPGVKEQLDERKEIEFGEVKKAIEQGIKLIGDGKHEQAIEKFDEVIEKFDHASKSEFQQPIALLLGFKGFLLGILGRFEEAIAVCDEVIARLRTRKRRQSVSRWCGPWINKGGALGQLNRSEEAIAVYDEVVARFADAEESAIRAQVARAMVNKGYRLGELNRSEEEIAVYDEVIARFADAEEVTLLEGVARAMVNKGYRLGQLNRSEEAIAVYDEVIARFADAEEAALLEGVAQAMVNKGQAGRTQSLRGGNCGL